MFFYNTILLFKQIVFTNREQNLRAHDWLYSLIIEMVLKAHCQAWDYFWKLVALKNITKNAFYFILKALFILKIFNFLFDVLVK